MDKKISINHQTEDPLFIVIDLFCGSGGVTTGFVQAMINEKKIAKVIACINHDHKAILSHWSNYPEVKHFEEDIRNLDLTELVKLVNFYRKQYPNAYVILWASLECQNFSKAKGGLARDGDSRTLAYSLHKIWNEQENRYMTGDSYIQLLNPDFIMIENVTEFKDWGIPRIKMRHGKPVMIKNKHGEKVFGYEDIPETRGQVFKAWCKEVCDLGYNQEWRHMNSADYGAYTSRNRLFGMFAKPGLEMIWPEPTHHKTGKHGLEKWNAVKHKLDFEDEGWSIFYRSRNPHIPKRQKKDLVDNTLERVYAGCIKHIAGGKKAFMTKYHGAFPGQQPRTADIDKPLPVITTQNRTALVQTSFLTKSYSGKPEGKNISVEGPAGTITTFGGSHSLVQTEQLDAFITQGNGGRDPDSMNISLEGPARTLTAKGGNQSLVQVEKAGFLSMYHGNGDNTFPLDQPAPTIAAADINAVVQASFLDKQYGSGPHNHQSIDEPAGAILKNDKHHLVQAGFIDTTNFKNTPSSIEEPSKVITANRKNHYLFNMQYKTGNMSSIEKPCRTILASSGKTPEHLIVTEKGELAIEIYKTDSDVVVRLKMFMALYGIVDIKMRMLRVDELLKIQGFPDTYKLAGTQEDQKKFIGNSVVPQVVESWCEAMGRSVIKLGKQKAA